MSNPLIVVDKIAEYFVGKVCQSVGRHVGFLFHYKRNVKNLEDERNNLQQQRSNVQEKVDQAGHRGEAIDNNVSDWLQEANEASQGVVTFMDVKAVKENMQCFNFSCPDFISRYRLSKQAKNKAVSIKQLAEKGSEIGIVSHPREDPPELELPSSRDYEDFHSRQKVFKDIVEALKDSNVNMVGVYGTGGVGIPIAIGNKRCKVVLTSRKQNVLENMGVQEAFHIEFLSKEEAWNLFKKKVGNHVDSHDQPLRDTAWAICNECKGLPVSINALGATLKGSKDMHAWKDALYKLKNSMLKEIEGIDPEVYASLRLKYLFSPSCARLLVQLEFLEIRNCSIMEGVIGTEGENDEDIVFSRLKVLRLGVLANLISFYPKKLNTATSSGSSSAHAQMALFNDKVAFPALERLNIKTLPNITNIWDKKIRPAHQRFCPQRYLYVVDCGQLVYVVPSNMLPQLCNLESLTLDSCPMAEVIVDLEKKEEGTQEDANNTIVPFPKLSFMSLKRLQKIKGFCAFRSEEQRLFNTQVAFPKLEKLVVDRFGEIALTDASELSLKLVEFYKCDEVSIVVSPHLFRRLRFVDLLDVTSCRGAREVFHFDGLEAREGQVCVGQLTQVRKVYLEDLPQLTCLWNKDPHRLMGLQSLEYLTITECPLLANLFIASVAKALVGLKVFYLSSCSTIEEVITTDEGHADAIDDDREIVFPKLEWLILKDLSNLKSFCTSNHNFNFPSLKRLVLKRCPKVQAFTSGSVLPQIILSTRGNECLVIEDLNKHLEEQHLKGDQETTAEDEMFGDEERFSDMYSLWKIVVGATSKYI
ncbi:hypothetical protein Vadar_029528 [Vaccinium darrowii]|uniref:Uncharacterized protein n=1 Tax=Vaccinium darrowii TaxID=229202 RepID=A0ACB7XU92_9ERIC|nr:hypothetical protein Vadar_029528 [Vaccinium darrowii]